MARSLGKPAIETVWTGDARRIAIAAVAVFVLVVLMRFPARWAAVLLPRGVSCEQLGGTLWDGSCSGLRRPGGEPGDLSWRLHPLRLLLGRLSADITFSDPALQLHLTGTIERGLSQRLRAHDLHVSLPLTRQLLAALPPGTDGQAMIDLSELITTGKRIDLLAGTITLRHVAFGLGASPADYRLTFPEGATGAPVGQLQDLGGPLAVEGRLRLTPEPGYVLDATLAARPGAPPEVTQRLRVLGAPDARGRYPLSLAGTY
jgi:hypothetical protein